jgi:hypothetical protein
MCWFRVIIIFCSAVFLGVLITEEVDVTGNKGSGNKIHQNVTDCAKQVVLPNCLACHQGVGHTNV